MLDYWLQVCSSYPRQVLTIHGLQVLLWQLSIKDLASRARYNGPNVKQHDSPYPRVNLSHWDIEIG